MSSEFIYIKDYKGLCISSGGLSGSNMLGILHYINENISSLKEIKYFAGTSAGALIALLINIGYMPIEILTYICNDDISKNFNFSLDNVSKNFGIYDIAVFKEYLRMMIEKRFGTVPTFKELYESTNRIFVCCSYCVTKKSRQYYSYVHTPDLSVLDAITRSSAIPFILTKYQDNDNIYVDGALFDHFPIVKLINIMKKNESDISKIKILGINIITTKINHINSYTDYVSAILNIFIDTQHKEEDNEYIIDLKQKGNLDIIEFTKEFNLNITDNIKQRIENFCNGIQTAKKYFKENKIKSD